MALLDQDLVEKIRRHNKHFKSFVRNKLPFKFTSLIPFLLDKYLQSSNFYLFKYFLDLYPLHNYQRRKKMLALTDLTSVFANNTIVLYTTTFLFAFYLTWVLFIRHHIHSHDRKKQAVRKYNYDKIKMATENNTEPFQRDRHVAYFKRCLTMLPQPYASNETSR